jgi:hypothetical protein
VSVSKLITLAIITLSVNIPAVASTVKTKDGRTLEGQIEGLVFLKVGWPVAEISQSGVRYYDKPRYYIVEPEDIIAVDEKGTRLSGRSFVRRLDCDRGNSPLEDKEVVAYILDHFKLDEDDEIESMNGGAPCYAEAYEIYLHLLPTAKILGRFVPKEGKLRFLPNLKITTSKGISEIPVADIIEFTKK